MSYTLIGFILYLLSILIIGTISYRMNKTHHDFFIAGRKLNPWVVAFSERASGESAWLLLGLPGAMYAVGLLEFWAAAGCVSGIILYWYIVAAKLRRETEASGSITLPDYIASRFPKQGRAIRWIATSIIIFFFTFYLSAQFNGAGKVLNVTFNIPVFYGMLIGTVIIVLYTMMGGFFAVAYTDLIQGIIMIGALIILPGMAFIILMQQGDARLLDLYKEVPSDIMSFTGGAVGLAATAVIISGLSWGFGYFGQPHLLTRFMSINDSANIRISRRIAIMWAIPGFTGAMLIGLAGLAMYGPGIEELSDAERIMPMLAGDVLPAWLAGIFISAAIAAMMSTADSQLLVITSSVIEDIYHKSLGVNISEKKLLQLSRLLTLLIGALAFIIALTSEKLIFSMVSYAWSGLGASFGPVVILMLWWKKTRGEGVIAGMLTGTVCTIIWSEFNALDAFLSVRFVSFVLAFAAVVVVSKVYAKIS
ncbi:MAG: sodium/proline symporter [Cyclobacteriaceae bacterium]|nr:sodium/proline symporter [Cyclobacteriaceae bacterium]